MPALKYVCDECDWTGASGKVLNARHPFIEGDTVLGCPKCREMSLLKACEIAECWDRVTCGLNTDEGYKQLCSNHGREFL